MRRVVFREKVERQTSRQERRLHPRLKFKTEVIFFSELKSYRTETLDISQSGIKIENYVPFEFMNRTLEIVVVMTPLNSPSAASRQKEFLKFQGVMVAGNRVHFLTDLHDSAMKLNRFLHQLLRSA